jgi:hypothetical protein
VTILLWPRPLRYHPRDIGPHRRGVSGRQAARARVRGDHISEPMAGSPLKRQRRKELRCIQPRIPMHQWRTFSDTDKIIAIFGMSLDEVLGAEAG